MPATSRAGRGFAPPTPQRSVSSRSCRGGRRSTQPRSACTRRRLVLKLVPRTPLPPRSLAAARAACRVGPGGVPTRAAVPEGAWPGASAPVALPDAPGAAPARPCRSPRSPIGRDALRAPGDGRRRNPRRRNARRRHLRKWNPGNGRRRDLGAGSEGTGTEGAGAGTAGRDRAGTCEGATGGSGAGAGGSGGRPTPGVCCADDAAGIAAASMKATATVNAPCMRTNLPSWVGDLTRMATHLRRSTVTIST
jgi:hypothetical protein